MNNKGKNIVVCCDGTGNEIKENAISNVLELYRRLDKSDPARQVTYYDPGLGTLPAPGLQTKTAKIISQLIGLAFGYGLPTNIKQAYLFLMQQYQPGDRIYLFGFSRGSYTVRALAGMIEMCGLLEPHSQNLVDYALKVHRQKSGNQWKVAARFRKYFPRHSPPDGEKIIHFVGVWDTVKSIGLFRRSLVLPHTSNMKSVAHGRHAVSLNEKRSKYRPNLWNPENGEEPGPLTGMPRFLQVWFPGVHSDIGGGYEEYGLSDIALEWMIQEARIHGLLLDDSTQARELRPNESGIMHNPLLPLWWLAGWWPREVPEGALIHKSVYLRREKDEEFRKFCDKQLGEDHPVIETLSDEQVARILSAQPREDAGIKK